MDYALLFSRSSARKEAAAKLYAAESPAFRGEPQVELANITLPGDGALDGESVSKPTKNIAARAEEAFFGAHDRIRGAPTGTKTVPFEEMGRPHGDQGHGAGKSIPDQPGQHGARDRQRTAARANSKAEHDPSHIGRYSRRGYSHAVQRSIRSSRSRRYAVSKELGARQTRTR